VKCLQFLYRERESLNLGFTQEITPRIKVHFFFEAPAYLHHNNSFKQRPATLEPLREQDQKITKKTALLHPGV
jgi:hypothetical protein